MSRPVRVLEVLGQLNRGGVETWLMHILRHIDRDRFRIDFLVHTDRSGAYDDEVRALGSTIIPCLNPERPWRYGPRFKRLLHEHGPYDVVHSHVYHYSGLILRWAEQAGVPIRIAHSHNTVYPGLRHAVSRWTYGRAMTHLIDRHATAGLGCSDEAASVLFGRGWKADRRFRTFFCGIDEAPFRIAIDAAKVRASVGVPADAPIIGHVGRMDPQKNHAFLLEVFRAITRRRPDARLLLIGDGPLRPELEARSRSLGIHDKIVWCGLRSDVPAVLRGATDVFVFPSLWEGLGLAVVEAQYAGRPCVISSVIPAEADIAPELVSRIDLDAGAEQWAEVTLSRLRAAGASAPSAPRSDRFDLARNLRDLAALYGGEA
jgi:glycosyltransferase involved in cell wall biosynthesis